MQIDDNIPLPDTIRRKGHSRYGFEQIGIGQSVFYKADNLAVVNIRSALTEWKKKNGRNFVTRERIENGIPGVRVWRSDK